MLALKRGALLLVVTALAGGVTIATACGSASSSPANFIGGPTDATSSSSGGSSGGSSGSGGFGDSGAANDGAPDAAPPPPSAIFVQASPSVPDARLCWAVDGVVAPVVPFPGTGAMPGSNYPGIPLGGASTLAEAGALGSGQLTLYAIDAENLARLEQGQTPHTCDVLICGPGNDLMPPCLRMNTDYWQAADVSGLSPGANVVALGGCLGTALDPAATLARCGPTWTDVLGNLHVDVAALGPAPVEQPGQLAVQTALLSPGVIAALGDAGAVVTVSFGPQDGGTAVATLATEGQIAPPSTSTVQVGSGIAAFGQLGFSVDVTGVPSCHEWMSLVQAQQLVDPTEDPTVYYGQPATYLVAVVGDPGAPHAFVAGDAGYDGTGLHLLVVAAP